MISNWKNKKIKAKQKLLYKCCKDQNKLLKHFGSTIKAKFKELHELLQLKEDAIVQEQSSQAE